MDAEALAELDRASYINLASIRRNGRAVETPVWFAEADGRLYVFSAGDAGKVKRLRNDPRIRLAICDVRGRVKGPWLEGRAHRLDDPGRIAAAHAALRRKYGWLMRVSDLLSRLTGRLARRAYLELEL